MIDITDPRFRSIGSRLLYGEFDGTRVGAVLATKSPTTTISRSLSAN
jgi:hypothetical protein